MNVSILEKAFDLQDFNKTAKRIVIQINQHLQHTLNGKNDKTLTWNEPENELAFWEQFLEKGDASDFFSEVFQRTTHTHHPKYVGHQVSTPTPITALTAMVSAVLNNGMAIYEMGMAPSAIEKIVIDQLCNKFGFDQRSGGFLTSGGTLANLTALLSARKEKVNHDVWNLGHDQPLGIMCCEQAHYCIDRAAKIMALGEKGIINVPAKANFSMDTECLEKSYSEATKKGIKVFAIVGSAPSTATGAYDDLMAIAVFAKSKDLWFHVDGAHGGAAIYSEKYRYLLNGANQADSVIIDGHKMMLMPTITTAVLFRNKKHAQQTFSQKADYLLDDVEDDWVNSGKRTFECTKTMMGMHWYILLKVYGDQLFDTFVTRQYDLTLNFQELLVNDSNFELATEPMANIVCFRYVDANRPNTDLNRLNAKIRQALLMDGEFYLVQTKLNEVQYLRTSLMNPFTTMEHLKTLLNKIKRLGQRFSR